MRALAALALLLAPGLAQAHGLAASPGWRLDPLVLVPLLACLLLYAAGLARLWRSARPGRGIGVAAAAAYGTGWLALAGALLSPLHALGEQLFTAHMVEHEIVMVVAAPLLVLGRPMVAALWAFPAAARRRIARALRRPLPRRAWRGATQPAVATLLHGAAIWLWHVPAWFEAGIANPGLHRLQHLSFLLSALLFWWAVLRRAHPLTAVAHLFVTMIHTGLLGTLLVVSPQVFYAVQTAAAAQWGLTPLEDQQLAGLVMWVPGGLVYVGAVLAVLGRWLARLRPREEIGDALAAR